MATTERQSDLPTFYIYKDKDGTHKTDEELTKQLNSPGWIDTKITTGVEFFPQWPAPKYKSQTRPAWKINAEGYKVVRTREIECEHKPSHGHTCRLKGDGAHCYRTTAQMLIYDIRKHFWIIQESGANNNN